MHANYMHLDKPLENITLLKSRFYMFIYFNKTLNIHIAMKSFDVKNKLNTSFLTLLAEMSPFDLSFEFFRTSDAF